jgi:nucleoside-diphosphate-sugar epimerase
MRAARATNDPLSRLKGTTMSYWSGKRVLVTGGAGFIGSNVAQRLLQEGAKVRLVDNLERGRLEYVQPFLNQVEFVHQDLRDKTVCQEACRDMEIVFHLASKVGGIGYYLSKPSDVLMADVLMDAYMLDAARSAGVRRYFYASSAHVYPIELQQAIQAPLIREDQAIPAHPELSYGWAKLIGEKQVEYAKAQGMEMRAAIFRLIGAFGPHQDLDLATGSCIPVFIRRAIEYPRRQPFTIMGTGKETRSYCYIDDVLDAMLLAMERLEDMDLVGPLNIGSEELISIEDLARMVIDICGKKIELVRDTAHKTVIWGQVLDCSKARQVLGGWQPKVTLRQGLEKVYAHIQRRLSGG